MFDWVIAACAGVFFGIFSSALWVWGSILYHSVLMDSMGQQPPGWMTGFFTKPLWTIRPDDQYKFYRFMQVISVILLACSVVLGSFGISAEFRKGWVHGSGMTATFFGFLLLSWFSAVLGTRKYMKKARAKAKPRQQ